jgi:hypothetical protein
MSRNEPVAPSKRVRRNLTFKLSGMLAADHGSQRSAISSLSIVTQFVPAMTGVSVEQISLDNRLRGRHPESGLATPATAAGPESRH